MRICPSCKREVPERIHYEIETVLYKDVPVDVLAVTSKCVLCGEEVYLIDPMQRAREKLEDLNATG